MFGFFKTKAETQEVPILNEVKEITPETWVRYLFGTLFRANPWEVPELIYQTDSFKNSPIFSTEKEAFDYYRACPEVMQIVEDHKVLTVDEKLDRSLKIIIEKLESIDRTILMK